VLSFTGGPFEGVRRVEEGTPSDVPTWPNVAFTTGASWKKVAAEYRELVDRKLEGANLEAVVARVVQKSDSPRAKAEKLLAWMRNRVRYVGVEFGDSSVVPRTPDETLKHGYGDCKDQAVVLVGLLRAAGVDAQVVLLRVGNGEDVIAKLPALNVFNHAIVVIPGPTPIYVDPTASRARAGDLLAGEQGRFALSTADGTEALLRLPQAEAADNTFREVRRIDFAEHGRSRVVESRTASGVIERSLRDAFEADAAGLAKWHAQYADKTYHAEPGTLDAGDPKDLDKRFAVTIEAKNARVATTGLQEASTWLDPLAPFGWVPEVLERGEKRKNDYALGTPQTSTVVYELHPPAGFSLDKKPEARKLSLGPATLEQKVETREAGVTLVTYTLVLPKSRWTPREVQDFRTAYEQLAAEKLPEIAFAHPGLVQHRARAYDKEVAAYRAELEKRPGALSKLRYASSLRTLGFGGAARKLADEVAATDPTESELWGYIGYDRACDFLGRSTHEGWDREGAIAAFRKARERDPKNLYATTSLVSLLEHDAKAERYAPGAQLIEAAGLLHGVPIAELAAYDDGEWVYNELFDLMWAGQFQAVRERAKEIPRESLAEVPVIVSAAMLGGPSAGLAEVDRLSVPAARRNATLVSAADVLIQQRRYPDAALLLSTAAAATGEPSIKARAADIGKTKQIDPRALPSDKPEDVVKKVSLQCSYGSFSLADDLAPIVSKRMVDGKGKHSIDDLCKELVPLPDSLERKRAVFTDVMAAMLDLRVDGSDETGHRVRVTLQSTSWFEYVVREGKQLQLRATSAHPSELGCEALALSKAGRKAAATQWLDWARESVKPAGGDDALRDWPFVRLWTDKKDDVEVSAAALCAQGGHVALATPTLLAARASATGERATILANALALAYDDGDHDAEVLSWGDKLVKELPKSKIAWGFVRSSLRSLGKLQEWRDRAADRLAKEPNDPDAIEELASAESSLGHGKEARALGDRAFATGKATASSYNGQAWRSLYFGPPTDKDLGYALQAVTLAPGSSGIMNTLAAVEAQMGQTADAIDRFRKSLELRGATELGDADWYVYGRIAEQLGLLEEAKAAYKKIKPAKKSEGSYSVRELADRRLKLLK
jgi:tetratricopeptide (TPR) repeat protein